MSREEVDEKTQNMTCQCGNETYMFVITCFCWDVLGLGQFARNDSVNLVTPAGHKQGKLLCLHSTALLYVSTLQLNYTPTCK